MNLVRVLSQMSPMRALMFGMGLAAIYYFIAFDGGSAIVSSISKHQEDLEKVKVELNIVKQKIEKAQIFEKTSAQLGQTLHSVLSYVPEHTNHSDLMKIVSDEVKTSGARLIKMRGIDEPNNSTFYQSVSIEVEVQGSFVQHMMLLSALTRVDQILTVDKLMIESKGELMDAESPWSTMRVTIKGYRYLPAAVKEGVSATS